MSLLINGFKCRSSWRLWLVCLSDCVDSEGQSAAIPVASMEFAAICLRNALLLLPEHQPQDIKTENNSRTTSQSGSTESGSENSDVCRFVYMTPKLQQAHTDHSWGYDQLYPAVFNYSSLVPQWQRSGGWQVLVCSSIISTQEAGNRKPQVISPLFLLSLFHLQLLSRNIEKSQYIAVACYPLLHVKVLDSGL